MAIDTRRFEGEFKDSAGATWLISIGYKQANGRAVPVDFSIRSRDGIQLTQRALREVPFSRIAWASRVPPLSARRGLLLQAADYRRYSGQRERRGSARLTPEEIDLTIKLFIEAYKSGRPTIRTIATQLGISRSAANKRIIMLRKAELLPPSRRSRSRGKSRL